MTARGANGRANRVAPWALALVAMVALVAAADLAIWRWGMELRRDDPRYYLGEAERLAERDDRAGAFLHLREGMRRAPESPVAHRVAGDVHFTFHEWDEAASAYERALALGSEEPGVRASYLWALIRGGRYALAAERAGEWLRQDDGDPALARLAGEAHLRAGEFPEAAAWFEQALAREPNDVYLMTQLERAYRAAGEQDQADALLDRLGPAGSEAAAP
jgi:predicted Zn-dependent protease